MAFCQHILILQVHLQHCVLLGVQVAECNIWSQVLQYAFGTGPFIASVTVSREQLQQSELTKQEGPDLPNCPGLGQGAEILVTEVWRGTGSTCPMTVLFGIQKLKAGFFFEFLKAPLLQCFEVAHEVIQGIRECDPGVFNNTIPCCWSYGQLLRGD